MKCSLPLCTLLPVLAIFLLRTQSAAQDVLASGALDKAEVRLPYLELRKLWEASQAATRLKEPEPLPPGALLSSLFQADLAGGRVVLDAEFKAESFNGKWEAIPLMGASLAVASVEPPDARLVVRDDQLCVLAKDPGPIVVKVRFAEVLAPTTNDAPFLKLATAPSAVAALGVANLPPGRLVKVKDAILPLDETQTCTVALPAKGGEVLLSLTDAAMLPKAEPPPPPPQPSEWSLQNQVLVVEQEGELSYTVRSHLIAQNGSALEAALLLPSNARAVKVESDDLAESRQVRTAAGVAELRLRWNTRDIMERELKLSYALQQLPLAETWDLRAPSLALVEKVKSLFIFALPSGVEFKATNLQAPVPVTKLPRWISEETKAPEFGTVTGAAAVSVQSHLLPRMETAVATITQSEYTMRLVGDGSVHTDASLEIEYEDSLRWSFSLPEKCQLLKCSLNGALIKPIAREAGVMEIPLERPANAGSTKSRITFSYTCNKGKLDAIEGETALELPLTPLFIQQVNWSLEIPATYEATGVEGNVEFATGQGGSSAANVVHLTKQLCRNERPQAQLFYRKRGLE